MHVCFSALYAQRTKVSERVATEEEAKKKERKKKEKKSLDTDASGLTNTFPVYVYNMYEVYMIKIV